MRASDDQHRAATTRTKKVCGNVPTCLVEGSLPLGLLLDGDTGGQDDGVSARGQPRMAGVMADVRGRRTLHSSTASTDILASTGATEYE